MNPEIIFEDKSIIVCYKPPKFPVQSDKTSDLDLKTYLEDYMKTNKGFEEPYIGLVHRIDRPVGGLVIFAKNPKINAALSKQLQDREIQKYYYAVVEGKPENNTLTHYLKKRNKDNTSIIVDETTPKAKKAILSFEVLETVQNEDGELSLIRIDLKTGRHHQIRVQLADFGFPLWGDTKYNPSFQNKKGWYQIALFAHKLSFRHPGTKKTVTFEMEPKDHPFTLFKNHA